MRSGRPAENHYPGLGISSWYNLSIDHAYKSSGSAQRCLERGVNMTNCVYLKAARSLVIFDQVVLLQDSGCCVHQVHPASLQQWVNVAVVMGDAI